MRNELLPATVGEVLAGKYRVERVLGVGGMGVVLAAWHLELDQAVALKFRLPRPSEAPSETEQFLREGRNASALRGPHVCRVLDVARLEDGTPYLVMEFLDGRDLGRELETRGVLPVSEAIRYLLQACEAMMEAHALGIIHRDLKPQNLFLARQLDGSVSLKVVDFGISKVAGHASRATTGAIGSPAYMAPEQARRGCRADAGADIYSLAAVLYHLVTGQPPFCGRDAVEVLLRSQTEPPERPRRLRPDLPRELEAILLRCLDRRPERRMADVCALADALRGVSHAAAGSRRWRRWPIRVAAGALAASAVAIPFLAVTTAGADDTAPSGRTPAAVTPYRAPVRPAISPRTTGGPAPARPRPADSAPVRRPARRPAQRPIVRAVPDRAAARPADRSPADIASATPVADLPEPPANGGSMRCRTDDFLCEFGGEAPGR
jgi:eukaryotic-like serine/threonine-protein kinase